MVVITWCRAAGTYRDVGTPTFFDRYINPIQIGVTNYAHHIGLSLTSFLTFRRPCGSAALHREISLVDVETGDPKAHQAIRCRDGEIGRARGDKFAYTALHSPQISVERKAIYSSFKYISVM